MSTSRQRCGSWLAWAVALAAGCAEGGKGGEAKGGDGADAGADTAAVDCATRPLDCDGEDNDCDDVIDEGGELEARLLWGVDADADGYSAAAPTFACAGADGERAVTEALDCDDARSEAHPGAVEDCVGVGDEDCSGLEGCADPSCVGRACTEVCDDGVDNDENGRADCADPACASRACAEDCDDGFDNDLDGWIDCDDTTCWGPTCAENCTHGGDEDADGAADCRDPECWRPVCPELCSAEGDEDADGLADCEDADCADACVEVCDDLLDNDRDGVVDCDDPDCVAALRCWTEVELRSAGPVSLQHQHRRTSTLVSGDRSAHRTFDLEVATVSIIGRMRTVDGASTSCTLRAHEVMTRWNSRTYQNGHSFSSGTWVDSWARAGSVDPPEGGCPTVDASALISDHLRLGGYSDRWFRTVVLLDVGRSWALDGLTIGPAWSSNGTNSIVTMRGPHSSIARTYIVSTWERSRTTATAVGFAPLP
jgi:hypothetical protein